MIRLGSVDDNIEFKFDNQGNRFIRFNENRFSLLVKADRPLGDYFVTLAARDPNNEDSIMTLEIMIVIDKKKVKPDATEEVPNEEELTTDEELIEELDEIATTEESLEIEEEASTTAVPIFIDEEKVL